MTDPPLTILLIEDNPADARFVRELLVEAGVEAFRLIHVEKLSAAYQRLGEEPVDVVLLDLFLPDSEGVDTFGHLRAQQDVPILVLTGLHDEAMIRQMGGDGAQGYLLKGQLEGMKLVRTLRDAIARYRMR